jgi:DNA (cytosine-5)-methyltransferase 1
VRFGSVCSGIEAASVAWHPLGWQAAWLAEIEPFPCAVLAHHYPTVPNLGDMTALPKRIMSGEVEAPDVFCGGTPCQAFSVAGLRQSLDDARGNLSLTFCEIADAIDHVRGLRGQPPAIIVWENVPGVLSVRDNAFGCFLAALAGDAAPYVPPRGKWTNAGVVDGPARAVAWRTLDAQYFGLAQRRRRVFVVASARNDFDPASVLFEFDGVRRDSAPSREAGQVAPTIPSRSTAGGGLGTDFDCDGGVIQQPFSVANCLTARMHKGINSTLDEGQTPVVTHTLRGEGFDASEDGTGRGTPLVPVCHVETMPTLRAGSPNGGAGHGARSGDTKDEYIVPVAYGIPGNWIGRKPENGGNAVEPMHDVAPCLTKADKHGVSSSMQVRRLTPVECERLQGFPDNYTAIPWRKKPASECPDGSRYKALGNSWAVPVVRWIGQRIAAAVA